MEIQFKNPKRFIALVLGLGLAMAGTVALPASATPQQDAVTQISGYADALSVDTPNESTYNTATGQSTANAGNFERINAYVRTLDGGDISDFQDVRAIVNNVVARIKIAEYDGDDAPRPTLSDFADAGIENVDAFGSTGLAAVRDRIADDVSDYPYAIDDIQGIVDEVNQELAIELISNYDAGDDDLTVELFSLAGIEGVTEENIDALMEVFATVSRTNSDEFDEIQDLVDAQIAKEIAIELIANYNGRNTEPARADYVAAGVVGVTAGNLEAMNALFEDISYVNSNTLEEIQAIVNLELARVAALARIAAYTGATNAPVLQTYIDAGVLRVDANNVTAVNVLVAGASSANSDTLAEIQDIVDDQIAALAVLTNYTGAGTALTLAQYAAAGITGVTATNLTKINIAIAAASVDSSNTALEVQTIVDGLNAVAVAWTKRISDTQAKLYAKNIVGAGKVQFFLNGKEIAWVSATDAADPKLRAANGAYYLVRTVNLADGKNVLEIKIKGVQVKRVVYSR